jgi:polyvinyl alcohol dehydrogenase (cytochrome)
MVCFFRKTRQSVFITLALVVIATSVFVVFSRSQIAHAAAGDWSTYLENAQRSGFNSAETIINGTSAPTLKMLWKYQAGGYISVNYISAQPVEAHGMIYWGSWDGNEHATNTNGTQVWQTGLGYTYSSQCNDLAGVASTATVATMGIGGKSTSVVFVGGGNASFYALSATTGAIIWQTSLGPSPDTFIWSSPVYYKGSIYIGLASLGDCPVVQGKLFRLNATTGAIQNTFNVVPTGCTGGGVWGSPTIDASDGSVCFATGNPGSCSSNEPYATSLVKVKASSLSLIDSWQVPQKQQGSDSDFGATSTSSKRL